MYDLHLHSVHSDGITSLVEICETAKSIGLKGLAITDHDTVEGLDEMSRLSQQYMLDWIPGIEFGVTYHSRECHILGYFINHHHPLLSALIHRAISDRHIRAKKTIEKLQLLNLDITFEEIVSSTSHCISRSHIAKNLVQKGYAKDMNHAFLKYLNPGSPAYVPKLYAEAEEIIRTIQTAGGVAVLAHPVTLASDEDVISMIKLGIDGLEVVNSKHTIKDVRKYLDMVDRFKLLYTCGSDCHGRILSGKKYIGNYAFNDKQVIKMKKLHELR